MDTSTTTPPATETQVYLARPDLRVDFIEAYGPKTFLLLSALGSMFLLPFSVNSFLQGRSVLAAMIALIVLCLLTNAGALYLGRAKPLAPAFLFGAALVALLAAMYDLGLLGILWAYPAILLFHFALPRRVANVFNIAIVSMAGLSSWTHLGSEVTARVVVTMLLAVLFTNIFSLVADAQHRKEAEQRQRLDLLVRGTNAGTLEWEADGAVTYSPRLREMLGRSYKADASGWDFFNLVHLEDRERVEAQFQAQMGKKSKPYVVRHQPPDDYRLLDITGDPIWVHAESITVADARGRTRRLICTFMDITERVQAMEALLSSHEKVRAQADQLERRNEALREAMRLREEVERIARHDLRTPLSSIASVPALLRERRHYDAQEEELLGLVERSALRVLSMVNLSLDLYKMEAGTYVLRPHAVDLTGLVRTVARDIQAHADSKGVALDLHLPAQPLPAKGEELLCYSLIANVFKNALEASPDGARVRVDVAPARWQDEDAVTLRIHNFGAVPVAVRAKFFEKYASHGKVGGSGLGTYSARLMARVQGGELCMATSEASGTVLQTWLPVWPAAAVPPVEQPGDQDTVAQPGPRRTSPDAGVLLVDDDEYNIMVMRALLPPPPEHIRTAVNGRAAVDSVRRARPDVIFMDLQMPVMDGLEATATIRRLQRERGEPPSFIVAFSAHDDATTREQCREVGFDHYLVKPASRSEVMAVFASAGHAAARHEATPPPASHVVVVDEDLAPLIPAFLESRKALVRELVAAAGQGERDSVRQLAHKLAGSLAMYGFEQAAALARGIEKGAETGEAGRLTEQGSELAALLDLTRFESKAPTFG
ncbi:MAG: response regulator [Ramlibacter sp.]